MILRMVAGQEGRNQRSLAPTLEVPESRIVALVDRLQDLGLLERRLNPDDRRSHALYLTDAGQRKLQEMVAVSVAHESALTEALTEDGRKALMGALQAIARQQGLAEGGHPGMSSA